MIDPNLYTVIDKAVRSTLAPTAIETVVVAEGHDAFDQRALFVTIRLPRHAAVVPGDRLLSTMAAVGDAVLQAGDDRFPFVRTQSDNEAETADDAETAH